MAEEMAYDPVVKDELTHNDAGAKLCQLVAMGEYRRLEDLLDHGTPVDITDGNGKTALWTAVKYGDRHLPITKLLLSRGATEPGRGTLLGLCDRFCNIETSKFLQGRIDW